MNMVYGLIYIPIISFPANSNNQSLEGFNFLEITISKVLKKMLKIKININLAVIFLSTRKSVRELQEI